MCTVCLGLGIEFLFVLARVAAPLTSTCAPRGRTTTTVVDHNTSTLATNPSFLFPSNKSIWVTPWYVPSPHRPHAVARLHTPRGAWQAIFETLAIEVALEASCGPRSCPIESNTHCGPAHLLIRSARRSLAEVGHWAPYGLIAWTLLRPVYEANLCAHASHESNTSPSCVMAQWVNHKPRHGDHRETDQAAGRRLELVFLTPLAACTDVHCRVCSRQVFFDITVGGAPAGRIEMTVGSPPIASVPWIG